MASSFLVCLVFIILIEGFIILLFVTPHPAQVVTMGRGAGLAGDALVYFHKTLLVSSSGAGQAPG